MIHQNKPNTGINRYPSIFSFCYRHMCDKSIKILSFGCSSGEELVTLAMHFPNAEIYGVEIDQNLLDLSIINTRLVDRVSVYNKIPDEKFDIIFCMSVFCRWPETKEVDDCSEFYKFENFEEELIELDQRLNKNGLLVIYNSNFLFDDTDLSKSYCSIFDFESGFVQKFNKSEKKLNFQYNKCVFKKL